MRHSELVENLIVLGGANCREAERTACRIRLLQGREKGTVNWQRGLVAGACTKGAVGLWWSWCSRVGFNGTWEVTNWAGH